ncbi:MAG: SpoIIE family protein phosphatase [Paludibacteraceae bacterium]|nr:SpoIIE family protein phosphatase [Paludibacteraceae bacterium]
MKTKLPPKQTLRSRAGLWLLIVAAVALESIACIQYFYSRAAIKDEAVYRAKAELRAAELEINVATAEMEAAAKVLAMMAEHNLENPQAMYASTRTLLETLDNVESAGIAFTAGYYPECGRWFEVCSSRTSEPGDAAIFTRQIGGPDHDYLQAEWFQNGLSIDSAWWSEPYMDDAGARTMVVSCSYPVTDKHNNVVAVVCIDMSIDRLQKVSQYLQVYPGSYYSITSGSGVEIVPPPDTIPGRKYMIFDEDIEATGWGLSIIIPEDILFADLNRVGLWVSLMMLFSLALLVFIMYRSAKNIFNLIAVNTQKERMEGELEIAQTIQNAMLPKVFPPFADRPDLNIYGMVEPAKEIGGDLYDFYVRHDRLFFCVGDVSGKGVPASLVMATIRSLFRSTTAHAEDPAVIAREINDTMAVQNDQNMFVTLFIGVLDLNSGQLRYCNAGHNAPVLAHRMLDVVPNLPIGVLSGFEYTEQCTQIARGETIFLYTDGLTEAEDSGHAQYGEERMLAALAATGGMRPEEVVKAMERSVEDFVGEAPQSDDLTMLAIRYQVPALVMRNDIRQIPTLAEWVEELHVPSQLNMPINLALEETVSNVMLYAYPGRNDGKVFVEYTETEDAQGKRLIFTVSDSGIAFDPTQKAEPDISLPAEDREIGGLGIHLVRQLMDEIRYERTSNKNILTLVKHI